MSAKVPLKFPRRKAARGLTGVSESRFKGTRTTRSTTFRAPTEKTIGTSGMTTATTSLSARQVGVTRILITRAPTTLTTTGTGEMYLTTAACGSLNLVLVGRRTAMAAGYSSPTTAGLGSPMNPGAGRRITMAAGSSTEGIGAGGQDRCTADTIRSGRPRTFPSSVLAGEAGALESALAAILEILAGCPAAPVIDFIPGTAGVETALMSSTSRILRTSRIFITTT